MFADLSEGYSGQAESVERRISLIDDGSSNWNVAVRDRVDLGTGYGAAAITTGFVTDAAWSVDGATLTLTKGGETHYVRLLGANRSWSVRECGPWVPETYLDLSTGSYKRVEVVLASSLQTSADITYVFSPSSGSDITPPAEITALGATRYSTGQADLSWTAPGNDGDEPNATATAYDIRYSSSAITDANWQNALPVTCVDPSSPPAPVAAGGSQTLRVSVPNPTTGNYYFAIRTRDERHNWSWVTCSPAPSLQ